MTKHIRHKHVYSDPMAKGLVHPLLIKRPLAYSTRIGDGCTACVTKKNIGFDGKIPVISTPKHLGVSLNFYDSMWLRLFCFSKL